MEIIINRLRGGAIDAFNLLQFFERCGLDIGATAKMLQQGA